ncbi:hypothetical protein BJY01DRAFT_250705 [Aspergillus pseudoustus]|uniref:Uncharacterized protein n=1 Tax=Aspergillus pseudoustus TaxID=1810923 RepID=A0ABR4JIN8_9EURO
MKPPVGIDEKNLDTRGCNKEYGSGEYAGLMQQGSGWENGIYYHESEATESVWQYDSDKDEGQFFFAGLWGLENMGNGQSERVEELDPDLKCRPEGIVFVDTNSDGYDDNNWEDVGQIKFSQEKDRANLRFADVNGDERDDMIWVDKFNGDGCVWYNRGPGDRSKLQGSYVEWDRQERPVYQGNRAGTCIYYPDFDGNGRADLHVIQNAIANEADTWYNPSCGLENHHGDDGSCCDDPKLPMPPAIGKRDEGDSGPGYTGGTVVYIEPSFWPADYGGTGIRDGTGITVNCQPPCTYVLPPMTFASPITVSFEPSQTIVEVGCSVSAGTGVTYTSIPVATRLDIPPTTATVVPVSNVPIILGISSTVIYPQISFQADPIVITDDMAVLASVGISCLPTTAAETRIITPIPRPWHSYPPATSAIDLRRESITITHVSAAPTATCTGTGCGQLCTNLCAWQSDRPGPDCTETETDSAKATCTKTAQGQRASQAGTVRVPGADEAETAPDRSARGQETTKAYNADAVASAREACARIAEVARAISAAMEATVDHLGQAAGRGCALETCVFLLVGSIP